MTWCAPYPTLQEELYVIWQLGATVSYTSKVAGSHLDMWGSAASHLFVDHSVYNTNHISIHRYRSYCALYTGPLWMGISPIDRGDHWLSIGAISITNGSGYN